MKILAIGDLHTKSWIIDKVEKLVNDYDHIVFCGDYADNFNTSPTESMKTWRLLKAFADANPDKVHPVIGNHDFSYLYPQIAGRSSGWNFTTYALINGPENKELKNWLLSLPLIFELDGAIFSHAGVTDEWVSSDHDDVVSDFWNDLSPIWARPKEYGGGITYKNVPQVIGHNPSEKIWNPQEGIWCIDTFSEDRENNPIGDQTVLEIIDGKEFKVKKL